MFLRKNKARKLNFMKSEILNKLENLLESENILSVQKEFKQLSAQFRSLAAHGISDIDESEDDHEDDHDDDHEYAVETPVATDKTEEVKESVETGEKKEPKEPGVESEGIDELAQTAEATGESTAETNKNDSPEEKEEINDEEEPDSKPAEADDTSLTDALNRFKELTAAFKEKTDKQRENKKKEEAEAVKTAKDLLEELKKLVENEENISKAFNGFNAIQEKWKSLPKVSNDSYRDLNAEYNKHAEKFFYNINIYKELKELDLKHNLDEKLLVLEDQKKLEDLNDIRRMEVEVRLNQDRWNEIGPTFKEEWDKIKDEFWNVTRNIYKKIQDFYNQRREQQSKNYDLKQGLLNRVKHLASLDLKSHKKWQEKTAEIIDIQKEWKMIGFVPKDKTEIWKEFRTVSDSFFEKKRTYYKEIRDVQDANKDLKMNLLNKAESLKDSDDWNQTSAELIMLQKEWKKIGPAHQRDENKMWRKFREACDHFFQKRKDQRSEEVSEHEENMKAKTALLKELEAFERGEDRNANIEALKEFAEKWRSVGHVPYKNKDKVNKEYKRLMDDKYGTLKIDKKEKEKIRFEQKLEDIKDKDQNDHLIRKEQDFIRNKISKLKSECFQLENNMGFFANSKGAEKLKLEVEEKVDKVKEEINVLKERLSMLRDA